MAKRTFLHKNVFQPHFYVHKNVPPLHFYVDKT